MKGQLLAALGIVISAGSLISAPAHAGTQVTCGITQHDIANSLQVTNNTTSIFFKGSSVKWATTNRVTGHVIAGTFILQSNFAPGQSVFASIDKNSSVSCIAAVNTGVLTPRH